MNYGEKKRLWRLLLLLPPVSYETLKEVFFAGEDPGYFAGNAFYKHLEELYEAYYIDWDRSDIRATEKGRKEFSKW